MTWPLHSYYFIKQKSTVCPIMLNAFKEWHNISFETKLSAIHLLLLVIGQLFSLNNQSQTIQTCQHQLQWFTNHMYLPPQPLAHSFQWCCPLRPSLFHWMLIYQLRGKHKSCALITRQLSFSLMLLNDPAYFQPPVQMYIRVIWLPCQKRFFFLFTYDSF